MTKSDLEKWRFLAPLVIVSCTLIPLVYVYVQEASSIERFIQTIITPISYVLAFFYSAMKLRNRVWSRELDKHVGAQIKTALIELVPDDLNVTEEEKKRLKEKEIWKKLTGVFWEAIDSDTSLVQQKEHFYANGVYYTASIDLFLILPFIASIYIVFYFLQPNMLALFFAGSCGAISALSRWVLLPTCRKRHLELSSEQLGFIKRNKKDFVSSKFRQIILEWRAS